MDAVKGALESMVRELPLPIGLAIVALLSTLAVGLELSQALQVAILIFAVTALTRLLTHENFQRRIPRGFRRQYIEYMIGTSVAALQPDPSSGSVLNLEDIYIDLELSERDTGNQNGVPLDSYLASETISPKCFAIIGKPGTGKSTLVTEIVRRSAIQAKQYWNPFSKAPLPVRINLNRHYHLILDKPDELTLSDLAERVLPGSRRSPKNWFQHYLKNCSLIVLFDGLDEVPQEIDNAKVREKVARWIRSQMDANLGNIFVVTSRPHGWDSNPIAGMTVLEINELRHPLAETYLKKWFVATDLRELELQRLQATTAKALPTKEDKKLLAEDKAAELFQMTLKNAALEKFTKTPLTLNMIGQVHHAQRRELPQRRVFLYRDLIFVLLHRRSEQISAAFGMDEAQVKDVLSEIAYREKISESEVIELAKVQAYVDKALILRTKLVQAKEFLVGIASMTGILIRIPETDEFIFSHATLKDFLASYYVHSVHGMQRVLYGKLTNDKWREVILLYAGQTDSTKILTLCLKRIDELNSLRINQHLTDNDVNQMGYLLSLASDCLLEGNSYQPELFDQVYSKLTTFLESALPELRTAAAIALRNSRARLITEEDKSHITCAEYFLFVTDERTGPHRYPDTWYTNDPLTIMTSDPVLGVRKQDAQEFCEWMSHQSIWHQAAFHLPRITADHEAATNTETHFWTTDGICPKKRNMLVSDAMVLEICSSDVRQIDEYLSYKKAPFKQPVPTSELLDRTPHFGISGTGGFGTRARLPRTTVSVPHPESPNWGNQELYAHALDFDLPAFADTVKQQLTGSVRSRLQAMLAINPRRFWDSLDLGTQLHPIAVNDTGIIAICTAHAIELLLTRHWQAILHRQSFSRPDMAYWLIRLIARTGCAFFVTQGNDAALENLFVLTAFEHRIGGINYVFGPREGIKLARN